MAIRTWSRREGQMYGEKDLEEGKRTLRREDGRSREREKD